MDRRLAIDDAGAAQLLGFIVGMAVVTAALATATYFIVTVPESGSADRESQELQGDAHRAIEVLVTTPGAPPDWGDNFGDLRRVGLLSADDPSLADRQKIAKIQDGSLTSRDILESWDINSDEVGLRVEADVRAVPIGDAPGVDTYGVVHGVEDRSNLEWTIDPASQVSAEAYADVNPNYEYEEHFWEFGPKRHPNNGLGNTVPDHAYFIETQLFPRMTGILATNSTSDDRSGEWGANDTGALADYLGPGQPESATRWHVVANESPYQIPGALDNKNTPDIDMHVLTVNWRKPNGADRAKGPGLWRVQEGARSAALLGGFDIGDAGSASLDFDHHLHIDETKEDGTDKPLCADETSTSCIRVRPSILFWNTTGTDRWTRLNQNPADCSASDVWDDWADGSGSIGSDTWDSAGPIDLCEAVEHSDEKVWLSLFWDTDCIGSGGGNISCVWDAESFGENKAGHTWFVDNIEITADGSTVYETDFEPPTERAGQSLFVADGVDHRRTYAPAPDDAENNTAAYITNMVMAGGNVVSLSPIANTPGEWLSQVGLTVQGTTESSDVETVLPGNIVMRYPNDLPLSADDYQRDQVSWQTGDPDTPDSWGRPNGFQQLDVVQQEANDGDGILMHGIPYADGGRVVALATNHFSFADQKLRQELYENMQGSSVFIDPTFETEEEVPDPGTTEVVSDRRVLLVGVTPNNQYTVPVEIKIWMWNRG